MSTDLRCFSEVLLMSTDNICFLGEIRKKSVQFQLEKVCYLELYVTVTCQASVQNFVVGHS